MQDGYERAAQGVLEGDLQPGVGGVVGKLAGAPALDDAAVGFEGHVLAGGVARERAVPAAHHRLDLGGVGGEGAVLLAV